VYTGVVDGKSVFIVDDDNLFIDVIAHKCQEEGMTCVYAPQGELALDMLEKGARADVVLLDLMLPGIDGFEVLRRIKTDEKLKIIPVILFSNDYSDENKERGRELGAAAFLEKVQTTPGEVIEAIKIAVR
jgi:CheY-like chemotaxis protein